MQYYTLGLIYTNALQKLDLVHRKTDANCIHRKDNAPKPLEPIISKL